MTLSEFKAWLEGYEESFVNGPNTKQWDKIKEKLNSISLVKPPVTREATKVTGLPDFPFRNVIVGTPPKLNYPKDWEL